MPFLWITATNVTIVNPQSGKTFLHFFVDYYYFEIRERSNKKFEQHQETTREFLEILLQRGVNLEAYDNEGFTPLMIACKKNRPHLVKMLIEKGIYQCLCFLYHNWRIFWLSSLLFSIQINSFSMTSHLSWWHIFFEWRCECQCEKSERST
jgi:hypothetical protein